MPQNILHTKHQYRRDFIKRPGVAGAVLQTPFLIIN